MIQAQQQKLNLIQRLLSASPEARVEIARQEDQLIDAEFFTLISRIAEAALAAGDEAGARQLAELQQSLLPVTAFGQELQEQTKEIEAAVASLQEVGDKLTRESLLDLIIKAPNENRLQALVSLTRPGIDYQFFQMLSDRIDKSRGDGRARLISIRDSLLQLTQEIDQQQARREASGRQAVEQVLNAPDPVAALEQVLPAVDDFFLRGLDAAIQEARSSGDLEKIAKIQKIVEFLQSLSKTPPEVEFIESLLDAPDDQTRRKLLDANRDKVTPELIGALSNITSQVDGSEDVELADKIKSIHRLVLRYSMELNLGS